jgi:peptidyl-prolyl cis-trans isomerase A (cyclophilin A)
MKTSVLALLLFSSIAWAAPPKVTFQTSEGEIVVELDPAHAPVTTANFLKYVKDGGFAGGTIYRTVTTKPDNQPGQNVKIDVIQGGSDPQAPKGQPIQLERTSVTHLKHLDGTISMARDTPNSATTEFFICIGAQPELDFGGKRNPDGQGFAAFGQVVKGMDVVRKIHELPANGQKIETPVKLVSTTAR